MEVVEVSGGREARKVQQQQRTNLPLSAHQKKRAALALPCLVLPGVCVVVCSCSCSCSFSGANANAKQNSTLYRKRNETKGQAQRAKVKA